MSVTTARLSFRSSSLSVTLIERPLMLRSLVLSALWPWRLPIQYLRVTFSDGFTTTSQKHMTTSRKTSDSSRDSITEVCETHQPPTR